jgi:preprotein translocase subunit SecF
VTDRQAALAYGALASCFVALTLLIFDHPSDRNLILAIVAGLVVGIGSWLYLRTR